MSATPEQKRAYRRRYYAEHSKTDARLRRQPTPEQRQAREQCLLRKRQSNLGCAKRRRARQAHYEAGSTASKRWRKRNPEWQFGYRLRVYGMTIEDYNKLLAEQQGVCAICQRPETQLDRARKPRRLTVDHDHVHNKVRGLLCNRCNAGLGFLEDDPVRIQAAQDYLETAVTLEEVGNGLQKS
jgi:hypothetical protein